MSGAVAERAQLPAYCIFSSLITGFVYPIVAHWVWSTSGWLSCSNEGSWLCMIDFAGSGVVHATGGIAALAGATIIGPRTGRFDASGHAVPMPGHSSVLQVLGTFILWLGWYGFNAGSTMGISTDTQARTAGRVVVTTTLSAAAGGITAVCLEKFIGNSRAWDVAAMCNGILAGLVSITAGCATVQPWAAIIMGLGGACFYRLASKVMLRLQIDDPLDAFAVHAVCGFWGIVTCAIFSTPEYTKCACSLRLLRLWKGREGASPRPRAQSPPAHHRERVRISLRAGSAITEGRIDKGGALYGGIELLGAACIFSLAHVVWVGTLTTVIFFSLRHLALLRVPQHDMAGFRSSKQQFFYDPDASTHGGQPFWPPTSVELAPAPASSPHFIPVPTPTSTIPACVFATAPTTTL